jgi:hypothetical protein
MRPLVQEAECMKKEMGGLFSKIARKGEVETANARIASSYVTDLYQHVDEAGRELEAFHADQVPSLLASLVQKY